MTMKKCKCGSSDFWLTETLLWSAELVNGVLECKNKDNTIDEVICKECSSPVKMSVINSTEINFN